MISENGRIETFDFEQNRTWKRDTKYEVSDRVYKINEEKRKRERCDVVESAPTMYGAS
jgi:hypothetical protein